MVYEMVFCLNAQHDWRTINSQASSMQGSAISPPSMMLHRISAALWPIKREGWLTTVSGGALTAAQG
jgi:hypothetical protein